MLIHFSQRALEASEVLAGRPIILQSKDGHALWVSKAVIDSIGDIPDEIEGGVIMRDAAGQPTGAPGKRLPSHKLIIYLFQVSSWTRRRISSLA